MKIELTSTPYWADFRAEHHHKFIGKTERGIEMVVFVSRVYVPRAEDQWAYHRECCATRGRDEQNKLAQPISVPANGLQVGDLSAAGSDPQLCLLRDLSSFIRLDLDLVDDRQLRDKLRAFIPRLIDCLTNVPKKG